MTATDELRRMLDERGVEHEDDEDVTRFFGPDGFEVVMQEDIDGKLDCLTPLYLTPEQAIVATLGRGTCRDKNRRFNTWECSECGATVLLMFDDFGEPSYCVDGVADVPRYCPNCGRRVVEQ